jgi:hypothetical protein
MGLEPWDIESGRVIGLAASTHHNERYTSIERIIAVAQSTKASSDSSPTERNVEGGQRQQCVISQGMKTATHQVGGNELLEYVKG